MRTENDTKLCTLPQQQHYPKQEMTEFSFPSPHLPLQSYHGPPSQ